MIIQPRMSARKWVDIAAGVFVRLRLADRLTVDPTECCGRCALATWPLPNRLEAFFSQGVIRDSGSIELDHVQRPASCPPPDHCKAAADVALDLERKAARVGPFPIEVPAKYADEY